MNFYPISSSMTALRNTAALLWISSATAFAEPELKFSAFATGATGTSDQELESHGRHEHDPNDVLTLQGVELGASAKLNDIFSAQANYNIFIDGDNFGGEWEDSYGQANLFNDTFIIRAGRIYNRIHAENSQHLHAWSFVNGSLLTTRFGGDEGLLSDGGELQYKLPFFKHDSFFSVSFSEVVGHEEEEEEGGEDEIDGEEAAFEDTVLTLNWRGKYLFDDFNYLNYRAHYSTGDNGFGRDAELYGLGLEYEWQEGGFSSNERYATVGVEGLYRDFDFASEDGAVRGNAEEFGVSLSSTYGFAPGWELAGRVEYLEGVDELGETPQLGRYSLALTRAFEVNEFVGGTARLQLDHEDRDQETNATALWFQVNLAFGSN